VLVDAVPIDRRVCVPIVVKSRSAHPRDDLGEVVSRDKRGTQASRSGGAGPGTCPDGERHVGVSVEGSSPESTYPGWIVHAAVPSRC
jgi:hypothetical protein